jgi:hypothetical protein
MAGLPGSAEIRELGGRIAPERQDAVLGFFIGPWWRVLWKSI